jgi:glycosyltransferase involved in cell wall biosynthesis
MRVVVNGWFWDQLATGSGQYLAGLAAQLSGGVRAAEDAAVGEVECVVLRWGRGTAGVGRVPPGWRVAWATTPFDRLGRNLAKLWFEQVAFPQAGRRLAADVMFVPYWGAPWVRPCPVAVTIHDLIPLLLPLYRGGLLQRAYSALVSATARRAESVLTDSEASRRDIIARLRISPERVHAVYLAVGPEYHRVMDADLLAHVRARYGLPIEPFFLYLGGFDARKNVGAVLRGYAEVLQAGGRTPPLVVAGKLPREDSAFAPDPRSLAEQLGLGQHVHFTGWVEEADKPAFYSLALAALFISEYEGFGLPVVEAQACGCPVITSVH